MKRIVVDPLISSVKDLVICDLKRLLEEPVLTHVDKRFYQFKNY